MTPLEYLAAALVVGGTFFGFVATVGIIRLPDLYSRLHASSKSDTLGSVLAVAGTIVVLGVSTASLKMAFLLLFLFLTSPTAAHAIARAGKEQEVEPVGVEDVSWIEPDADSDATDDAETGVEGGDA